MIFAFVSLNQDQKREEFSKLIGQVFLLTAKQAEKLAFSLQEAATASKNLPRDALKVVK
jgi:hypothetical protein